MSYSTIINLEWYYNTIARPSNGLFLYFDAKIWHIIAYVRLSTDAINIWKYSINPMLQWTITWVYIVVRLNSWLINF